MRQLLNDYPATAGLLLLTFAGDLRGAGRGALLLQQPPRAPVEGGPMSQSVLFDAPGPRTIRPTPGLHGPHRRGDRGARSRSSSTGSTRRTSSSAEKWEVFTTPDYLRFILVDGLIETLKMAACGDRSAPWCSAWCSASASSPTTGFVRVPVLGHGRVLPGGAGAAADDLLLLPLRHRPRRRPARSGAWCGRCRSTTAPCSPRCSAPASSRCRPARPRPPTPSVCARAR